MKRIFYTLAGILLAVTSSFAQTYHFSVSSEPYSGMTAGTPLVSEPWDDPDFVVPIGFTFHYFDKTLTELYQLTDFSSVALINEAFNDTLSFIVPYGTDLIDRGFGTANLQSPITYHTSGTAGHH